MFIVQKWVTTSAENVAQATASFYIGEDEETRYPNTILVPRSTLNLEALLICLLKANASHFLWLTKNVLFGSLKLFGFEVNNTVSLGGGRCVVRFIHILYGCARCVYHAY